MQREDLAKIVEDLQKFRCEMQTIEAKAAHEGCPTKLYDTLSSFSNQDGGGVIIFGVDENKDFEVVGVYNAQDLMQRVAEQCKQMQPQIRPLFTVCDLGGRVVVSAEIPGLDIADRPAYYKGVGRLKGSFVRVGNADEPLSDYEIYSFDAYKRQLRDDLRIVEGTDSSHLEPSLLEKYLVAVRENKPNLAKLDNCEILELMGILKRGTPTLAGILLFSKYPQAFFPQLCITAVVVPGTQIGQTGMDGERFLANKRIEGTIDQMLDEAMLFVGRNIRVKTIIDDFGKRQDRAEYPPKAIREAIINALMHRDYSIYTEGTPVQIIMYNDRLEIINPGSLYGKLTIDKLGKIHGDTRNKTVATSLEILKLAENRYSGIPTIRQELENYNLPVPIFENRRGSFVVTFTNDSEFVWGNIIAKDCDPNTKLLRFCKLPRTRAEIASFLGLTQYYAIKTIVTPLLEEGKLLPTIPDKPKSRYQKYVTAPYFK